MLLSTLKLRPQPSKVQTNAEDIDAGESDSAKSDDGRKLTFFSGMTVQVDLADTLSTRKHIGRMQ